MDQQFLINCLIGGGAAVFSWVVNKLWDMVKTLQTDVSALHIELARNYVPRTELDARLTRIQDTVDEIREHLRSATR